MSIIALHIRQKDTDIFSIIPIFGIFISFERKTDLAEPINEIV